MKTNTNLLKCITLFTIMLISITAYYGCKKEVQTIEQSQIYMSIIGDFMFKSTQPTDGNINLSIQDQTFARYKNDQNIPFQSVSAGFYKNRLPNIFTSVNKLIIDGKEIKSTGLGYRIDQYGLRNDTAKWLNSLWGRTVTLNIDNTNTNGTTGTGTGSNTGSITSATGQLYIPSAIQINYAENSLVTLRKSGQEISWNPDPNSPNKKVIILIMYNAYTSRLVYPSMPEKDIIILQKEVDDTGNYTLTSNDLKDLILNSSSYIEVGRGNYATFKDNNDSTKNVFVTALTTSKQPVTVIN
jgi:hypothetical protein